MNPSSVHLFLLISFSVNPFLTVIVSAATRGLWVYRYRYLSIDILSLGYEVGHQGRVAELSSQVQAGASLTVPVHAQQNLMGFLAISLFIAEEKFMSDMPRFLKYVPVWFGNTYAVSFFYTLHYRKQV